MSNDYTYSTDEKNAMTVSNGVTAVDTDVNVVWETTDEKLSLITNDVATIEALGNTSYKWASSDAGVQPEPTIYPDEYSSRAWAEESKEWAISDDGVINEADGGTVSEKSAKTYAGEASASASAASTDAGLASDSADASATSEINAATSAAEAAESATNVGVSEGYETLVTSANVVDVVDYFVADDSDGGEWTKRMQDKSWYNETLNTATRGATRDFPAHVKIVAETDKVTIYDATDPAMPMWMVVPQINSTTAGKTFLRVAKPITSISMLNGVLAIGVYSGADVSGIATVDFVKDNLKRVSELSLHSWEGLTVFQRLDSIDLPTQVNYVIVDRGVNAVAMTVIPEAPINTITGTTVPTIAVATDGGVSVIDGPAGVGTVVDSDTTLASGSVEFLDNFTLVFNQKTGSGVRFYEDYSTGSFALTRVYNSSSTPSVGASLNKLISDDVVLGSADGLTFLKENPTTPAEGSVAYVTDTYNTGWMKGDIRVATLSDNTEGGLTGLDGAAVVNGDFPTDTSGWTPSNATLSIDTARLKVLNDFATFGYAVQDISVTSGNTYTILVDVTFGNSAARILLGSTTGASDLGSHTNLGTNTYSYDVTATSSTISVSLGADTAAIGEYSFFDNVEIVGTTSLVTNGFFGADTDWIKGAGWSIGSGVASKSVGTLSYLEQDLSLVIGDKYIVTYTISNYSAGAFKAYCGSSGTGISRTADGTYTETITASGSPIFSVQGNSTAIGDIDNIVVSEVIEDRSVKGNPLSVIGTISRAAVATGADLVAYSGFSTTDYIEGDEAEYADTQYIIGWQEDVSDGWVFKHGVASTNPIDGITVTGTVVHIEGTLPKSLIRLTATVPTDEDLLSIYDDEKRFFEDDNSCLLPSANVQSLSYDPTTDTTLIGTDSGATKFKGLSNIEDISDANLTSQDISAVSYLRDSYTIASTAEAVGYIPAIQIRDELVRIDDGKVPFDPIINDTTASGGETDFPLDTGFQSYAVYVNGLLVREGSGDDYIIENNGTFKTVVLSVALSVSDWISIHTHRSN